MTNGHTPDLSAEKAYGDSNAIRRSVIETDQNQPVQPTSLGLIYLVAGVADEIRPWGTNPTMRDRQLREFLPMESFTMSAFGTVAARNMAFSWKLDGPTSTVERVQDILINADQGRGWESLIAKTSLDYYSQDKGAFWELVRETDDERAPVIGLNHLDADRCWHTRNTEFPVIYMNDKGRWIPLKWYQVLPLSELPVPHERLVGMQYCALTRVLRMSQIFRNLAIYFDEKTGGRSARSLHILGNVREEAIRDAMTRKQLLADSQGLLRHIDPVLVETFDPAAVPSVVTLDFASIPDGFDLGEMNKWYLTAIAMGLFEDYQTFAPLPGGGLGTATQSQTLHAKARGKGPGLWMKTITHALNFRGILPRNVTFSFDEQDQEAETAQADLELKRAQARAQMIANGEIDAVGARQLALDKGDMPQELFDAMQQQDLTFPALADSQRVVADGEQMQQKARLKAPLSSGVDEERIALEEEVAAKMGEGFSRVHHMIEGRLRGEKMMERSRSFLSVDLSGIEDRIYQAQVESAEKVAQAARQPAPIVNVDAPIINVAAPEVHVEAQPAPIVNIEAPRRREIVRKEVRRTDPNDPKSPIAEVIEYHEEVEV